jgi:sugar/nucleoside kinase (ribokinase family)
VSLKAHAEIERPTQHDLLTVGHANIDRIISVSRLPEPDRTVPIADQRTELGGTAVTIARVAAQEWLRVALAARVGPDFPARFRDRLSGEGIDLTGFEVISKTRSPSCFIFEDGNGSQMTFIDQGSMVEGRGGTIPTELVRSSAWVHLTTGPVDLQLRTAEKARDARRPVSADPAQEIHYRWSSQDLVSLFSSSEILFGNESEVRQAARLLSLPSIARLTDRVPLVIMTRGPLGCIAYHREGVERVPALRPSRRRRVTGAGDAFRGGFYAGWLEGQPLRECLRHASWAAARWIGHPRPSITTRARRQDLPKRGERTS